MPVSFVFAYMLTSIMDTEEHEKYLFLPLYGNMENSHMKVCTPTITMMSHSVKEKGRLCFVLSAVLHFTECKRIV